MPWLHRTRIACSDCAHELTSDDAVDMVTDWEFAADPDAEHLERRDAPAINGSAFT